jgi:hypothetical protein
LLCLCRRFFFTVRFFFSLSCAVSLPCVTADFAVKIFFTVRFSETLPCSLSLPCVLLSVLCRAVAHGKEKPHGDAYFSRSVSRWSKALFIIFVTVNIFRAYVNDH